MKKGMVIGIIIVVVIIIVAAILIFSNKNQDMDNNEVQNVPGEVTIKGFAFNPSTITIKVGESVKWVNEDSVVHTVSSDSGSELDSGDLSPGEEYSHTFTTPGTYAYHCNIHISMKGTVIVG